MFLAELRLPIVMVGLALIMTTVAGCGTPANSPTIRPAETSTIAPVGEGYEVQQRIRIRHSTYLTCRRRYEGCLRSLYVRYGMTRARSYCSTQYYRCLGYRPGWR